jgi:hypothetical protein
MSQPSESTQEKEDQNDLTKRRGGDTVEVVIVLRRNAKSAKTSLENANLLHPNFRMTPADPIASIVAEASDHQPLNLGDCIAIPVVKDYEKARGSGLPLYDFVMGSGIQWCPYSTAILGNRRPMMTSKLPEEWNLNQIQAAVLQSKLNLSSRSRNNSEHISQPSPSPNCDSIVETMRGFVRTIVPTSCEVLGDDRTLVITPHAFAGEAFENFLCSHSPNRQEKNECFQELWNCLASSHGSSRIVRRGAVDPNSRIRESGYRLVWPIISGIPNETGTPCKKMSLLYPEKNFHRWSDPTQRLSPCLI